MEDEWRGYAEQSHLAVADLDGDGTVEVLAFREDRRLAAIDPRGVEVWVTAAPAIPNWSTMDTWPLEVRDIDADGDAEVITLRGVVGHDGAVVAETAFRPHLADNNCSIAVGDVDGDASPDAFVQWRRFAADGLVLWDVEPSYNWRAWITPMLVQADTDDDGEVVWVGLDSMLVLDPDGTTLAERSIPGDLQMPGLPCAGDVDGDGETEIITAGMGAMVVMDTALRDELSIPMIDETSGFVGCTTFDFDADGDREIVSVDATALYVVDGFTGDILYSDDTWASYTYEDMPFLADLDGDGSADILVVTRGSTVNTPLRTWRNVNRDWPPGMAMWPTATWSGTSVLPDGRVPRTPREPWREELAWRGQPADPVIGADLRPKVGEHCVASCEDTGEVRVEVRIVNRGPDEIDPGMPLAVYGGEADGARVLLDVLELSDWLDDGRESPSWEIITTVEQARSGLVFVAGDDGGGSPWSGDCHPENNELGWRLTDCPER